jgi:hypothetical protein
MRLRQVVLVARDLDRVVGDLTAVLGIEVAFNDPAVAEFGLRNAVMPIGDTFLEVVSPVDPQATAERYLDRRRGDGGYMLIVQSSALDRDRERFAAMGIRTVWKADLAAIRGTHLHPKDTGGTLLSVDDATPAESWQWAGPEWQRRIHRDAVDVIIAAEIQARDPRVLAERWSEILDRPARELPSRSFEIELDSSALRFVEDRDGRGEGLAGFDVRAVDRRRILEAARPLGITAADDCIMIGGAKIRLV